MCFCKPISSFRYLRTLLVAPQVSMITDTISLFFLQPLQYAPLSFQVQVYIIYHVDFCFFYSCVKWTGHVNYSRCLFSITKISALLYPTTWFVYLGKSLRRLPALFSVPFPRSMSIPLVSWFFLHILLTHSPVDDLSKIAMSPRLIPFIVHYISFGAQREQWWNNDTCSTFWQYFSRGFAPEVAWVILRCLIWEFPFSTNSKCFCAFPLQ